VRGSPDRASGSVIVLQLQSHKVTQVVSQAHRRAVAQADVGKNRLAPGSIDILVAQVRAVRAETFGNLSVEARRVEHSRSSLGCMAKDPGPHSAIRRSARRKPRGAANMVSPILGEFSGAKDPGRLRIPSAIRGLPPARKDLKIDGLVVVLINDVLHLLVEGRTRVYAVANFGDVVQAKRS